MRAWTVILTALIPLTAAAQKKPRTAIRSSLVLKVSDRDKTADTLIDWAEKADGYFTTRTDDQVTLKVPVGQAKSMVARIEPLGKVIQKDFQAQDVGARLDELRTRLKSKQSVFQRYFAVLNTASQNNVIEVESEMTSLVQEIETLKGSIRLIEHQLQFAEIVVSFQFRERRAPVRDGSSSFAWLNTVNLADLFEEFARAY